MSAARISTTILASMWACTRTSACIDSLRTVSVVVPCIASLRTVSVVVRACGFHGWSSWLGTCSPGSGAVRASSQSRAALLTRPPVSRINGMKLSWSAYFAASPGVVPLPGGRHSAGAHHADVEDPRVAVLCRRASGPRRPAAAALSALL
jgi:hypothetical protein